MQVQYGWTIPKVTRGQSMTSYDASLEFMTYQGKSSMKTRWMDWKFIACYIRVMYTIGKFWKSLQQMIMYSNPLHANQNSQKKMRNGTFLPITIFSLHYVNMSVRIFQNKFNQNWPWENLFFGGWGQRRPLPKWTFFFLQTIQDRLSTAILSWSLNTMEPFLM